MGTYPHNARPNQQFSVGVQRHVFHEPAANVPQATTTTITITAEAFAFHEGAARRCGEGEARVQGALRN